MQKNIEKFIATLTLSIMSCLILFSPMRTAFGANVKQEVPLKIGFIMAGSASDYGYNYAQNQGRLYLQAHLPNVQTTLAEKVPETAEAERVMEKLVAQGNCLLFSTSYGYLEPAERVAKRHPEVIILQGWRPANLRNISSYAAYLYEPLYVAGMVAGKMTKKNSIGVVCSHPIPVTMQNINALTLGARSVNSKIIVHVIWTNSWSDPPTEAEATKVLIESGADVVANELGNPLTVAKTAEQNHVMTISNQTDLHEIAPNGWLTGANWNWGATFCAMVKSVQNQTWQHGLYWFGMKDGTVNLCSFGKIVPRQLQTQAMALAQQIKRGKKFVFIGPLKDREGRQRLAAGQVADAKLLSEMNWFVPGIEGPLPNK